MQARAIFEAAINVQAKGLFVLPNIMIPLIGTRNELDHQAEIVRWALTNPY
jgi:pyruvate,orthophosphate dikinase